MATQLPNERVVEILSGLPSKSLICFQSMCKSWWSLISSTEFRLMHFHNFNKPNPRYLVRRFELRENREVYTVHLDDQHFTLDADAQIKFPFRISSPNIYSYGIIGCCHGVVCFCNDDTTKDEVILWNPSVRRNLTLIPPIFPNSYWYDLFLVLGFGYDTVSDDYKVVRVAMMYSSSPLDLTVVTFPDDLRCFFILPNQSQVFFNGFVHWIASDPIPDVSYYSIMTFDMSTKCFGEIELPKDLVRVPTTKVVITIVEEFLDSIFVDRYQESLALLDVEHDVLTYLNLFGNLFLPSLKVGHKYTCSCKPIDQKGSLHEYRESKVTNESATTDNPSYQPWVSNDAHIRMLIISTVSEESFQHIQGKTSREVWLSLERAYAPVTSSHEFTLKSQLLRITMKGDEKPAEYLSRAQEYATALANIGEPMKDKDRVMLTLAGLREEYNGLKANLLARSPPVNFNELHGLLSDHDYMITRILATNSQVPQAFLATASSTQQPLTTASTPLQQPNLDSIQQQLHNLQLMASQLGYQLNPAPSPRPQAYFGSRSFNNNSGGRGSRGSHVATHGLLSTLAIVIVMAHVNSLGLLLKTWCMVIVTDVGLVIYHLSVLISLTNLVQFHKLTMLLTQMLVRNQDPLGGPTLAQITMPLQIYLSLTTPRPTSVTILYLLVTDESTLTILLTGPSEQGLYSIRLPKLKSLPKVAFTAVKASSNIWHQRLGHPHAQVFRSIISHSVYLINRLPSRVSSNKSPYEHVFKRKPDYSFLRVFGCQCFPYLRPYNRHKIDFRSTPCVFLGYSPVHHGYRCFDPSTERIYIARHVRFNEHVFPYHPPTPTQSPSRSDSPYISIFPNPPPGFPTEPNSPPPSPTVPLPQPEPTSPPPSSTTTSATLPTTPTPESPNPTPGPSSEPNSIPTQPPPAPRPRPPNLRPNPKQTTRYDPAAYTTTTTPTLPVEPTSFTVANKYIEWRQAMADELAALHRNGTLKTDQDGKISRYKARLVAKGFHQQHGVDYHETFSPVIKPATIRTVLSLAVTNKWSLRQLDIQTAFLHGDLQETVYMRQPPGFVDPDRPDYVCLLNKSLYGLKQAPRAWFTKLSTALHQLGFYGSKTDPSLLILNSSGTLVYLLVYVDDIIITGNNPGAVTTIIDRLHSLFALKDLGQLHYFLGIEVVHHGSDLVLFQRKYVLDILHRAGLADCKPVSSPMSTSQVFLADDSPLLDDPSRYRQIVGALQYATLSRPDIAFAVNKVCQFMHAPTENHWAGVKRILRYLKGTLNLGLLFRHNTGSRLQAFSNSHLATNLRAYSDLDWAGCPIDPELIWLKSLLHKLGLDSKAPTLWCDNLGATYLSANPVFHARTKHVEVDYHFVREQVTQGKLNVKFISTDDQIADVFTKPLSSQRFEFLRSKLQVVPRPQLAGEC
ncbi:hypothetical protein OSB04_013142 [Centaurea solstitialis]|uniref:F-box domain-containing protein n=1 Tax=Centaurea solstitialis TaxID=347529 RepID=A0AA38TK81_9ASTR|nr:hypothetical protein OSB04_013142 [Centaurea solstitialis]